MIPGIVVGAVGVIALGRMVLRRQRWYRHNHRFYKSGGPFFVRRLSQKLELDRAQRAEIESLYIQMRGHFDGLRMGAREFRGALADALASETFDRTRLDQILDQKRAALADARGDMVAGLARVHDILTPLQREQLGSILGRRGGGRGATPAAGPYR